MQRLTLVEVIALRLRARVARVLDRTCSERCSTIHHSKAACLLSKFITGPHKMAQACTVRSSSLQFFFHERPNGSTIPASGSDYGERHFQGVVFSAIGIGKLLPHWISSLKEWESPVKRSTKSAVRSKRNRIVTRYRAKCRL